MKPWIRKTLLAMEFVALFAGLPLAYIFSGRAISVIPILVVVSLCCLFSLLASGEFDRRLLWNAAAVPGQLPRILLVFGITAAAATAGVALLDPSALFYLPRRIPLLWLLIMVAYPVLSVYPQSIIFRAFLFHRYRELFTTPAARMAASALAFGFAHVVFRNWLALAMTTAGGLLFAFTYHRSRSLLAVWIEHALYGCLVFTVGLGSNFYHGAIHISE